ncbi:YesL family protein [Gracilibacillus salinarum]|uniref:YesL family protein n=1 Tax=Gracilibacillus salinarum TaxID=2932255 RepID=A0ABY4GH88_9BACI|nr:YesL family protein [Gracilibacillus salinarum]UOQ83511.1 YesL family protein [Gracilibacillus salinarum]
MNILESKVYKIIELVINIIILNGLWLLCSIPIITIGPATHAMYQVLLHYVENKETSVARPYFSYFKKSFKSSLFVGLVLSFLAFALIVNFMVIAGTENVLFLTGFSLLGLLLFAMMTFVFPIQITHHVKRMTLFRNALFYALGFLPYSVLNLCIVAGVAVLFFIHPATIFVSCCIGAYFVLLSCRRAFMGVEDRKKAEQGHLAAIRRS